jgi:hypothetical protein
MLLAGTSAASAADWRTERLRADIARDRARLREDIRRGRSRAAARQAAELARDERALRNRERYWR